MATYRIIVTSWVLWVLTLVTVIICGGLIIHEIFPNNKITSVVSAIGLILFSFFIQRYISRGEVEIYLTSTDLSIKWLKQFIFHKRPDVEISLADIASYKYQEDKHFDLFKLCLKNGTELKFWHFRFTHTNDFEKLVLDFVSTVTEHNREVKQTLQQNEIKQVKEQKVIKREKTIFESASSPALAVLACLLLVGSILFLWLTPSGKISNHFIIISGMSGALFFLGHYFKYRKRPPED